MPDIEGVRHKFGSYVRFYEDEGKLNLTLAIGLFGEDALKGMIEALNSLPEASKSVIWPPTLKRLGVKPIRSGNPAQPFLI